MAHLLSATHRISEQQCKQMMCAGQGDAAHYQSNECNMLNCGSHVFTPIPHRMGATSFKILYLVA